ncbi:MAG: hypothetical protein EOO61_05840 [Hymenobacter sp.]|nr:MAG: hypothetical protein EOO61_05840 [Hymenobacter sp.]
MIKVYLDWNVMAQIKDGQHQELKEILSDDKRFFKPYSTSHISDILSSFKEGDEQQDKRIERDLKFISELTNNHFLSNNGKEIVLNFESPETYYNQRVDELGLYNNFNFDSIFQGLNNNEDLNGLLKVYSDILKQTPLDDALKNMFDNPDSAKHMDDLLPGLKDNLTMGGFMDTFGKLLNSLNTGDKYKDLRHMVQNGLNINRDKIYNSENPYEIIEKSYKKLGIDMGVVNEKNAGGDKYGPKWFNEITNSYIQLDIYGYQEDNININKGRKETFRNTTEDAFHAAFATTCDFYVVNDAKGYRKAKKIYEKLNIKTYALKPVEFVEYYDKYLNFEENTWNLSVIPEIINKFNYVENKHENGVIRIYYVPYYVFNFFNKVIVVIDDNEPLQIILSHVNPTNGGKFIFEIAALVNMICDLLGSDIDNLGEIKENEFETQEWIGRRWNVGDKIYRLASINDYILLYLG